MYAYENGCHWDDRVHQRAAQNGHINCMEYAHKHGLQWPSDVCELAAFQGHLACLAYAHENGGFWDRDTVASAAQNGHIACLGYALEQGCPHDEKASNMACLNGHLACLQLLRLYHSPWDATTSVNAAVCAEADCLRYLHQHGCPWDVRVTTLSAKHGRIHSLRYALESGCPYTEHLMVYAAFNCLECLQYLVSIQGLYMYERVFMAALLYGDVAILKFLVDQYCPYLKATFSSEEEEILLYDKVFRRNNPDFALCVAYAMERGWIPDDHFKRYVISRDESVGGSFFAKEEWNVRGTEL